jgi:phosphonopyruvate decarboxylase
LTSCKEINFSIKYFLSYRDSCREINAVAFNPFHIVINNGAHETVGGMPTVASNIDLVAIAKACGYPSATSVDNFTSLDEVLKIAKESKELTFIEVKCSIGARDDLGRPTTTALENKHSFMKYVNSL